MEVLRTLDGAGHRSWLVGGAVRDLLLHRARQAADFDVATPARPEMVVQLFRRVIPTGIAHGTVTVMVGKQAVEVTTFRGEGAYLDGRRPEAVTFHDDIEADLSRRDFTMNALAFDPLDRDFRDPFDGRGDIRRKRVRSVGDAAARFGEDGLRPMRAVRFAAQLGFALEPATAAAISGALGNFRKVSAERITDELSRLLVAGEAHRGLALMRDTGLLAEILPRLAAQGTAALEHAGATVRAVEPRLPIRLAALLHPMAPAGGEGASAAARESLSALRLPNQVVDEVAALVGAISCLALGPRSPWPPDGEAVRRWLFRAGRTHAAAALALWEGDAKAAGRAPLRVKARAFRAAAQRALRSGVALQTSELGLDGRAVMALLGVSGGPVVGEALRHLLDRVLEEPRLNKRDALQNELRRWWEAR
jgi:tRNA nucleotidyltransferase (CCA-adding enzyme)